MAHTPPIRSPELEAALTTRPDAEALRATWDALAPLAERDAAPPAPTARDAAWSRLMAQLEDPTRVAYTDDVPAPIALVDAAPDRDAERPRVDSPVEIPARPAITVVAPARTPFARSRFAMAIAAAATLAVGLGTWRTIPVVHTVPAGGARLTVALGEGSTVVLDAGTTLSVSRAIDWPLLRANTRDVTIEGTAFLTVARDGRPFVVHTGDADVRVLGTRFEVRSATAASGTRVTVEEGRVAVAARGGSAPVTLGAGEAAAIDRAGGTAASLATRVPVARVAAWRTGGLAAIDEPLGSVLAELARRHGTSIVIEAPDAADVHVSLFYPQAPALDAVLADLCTAQGLRFVRTSDGYRVTAGS